MHHISYWLQAALRYLLFDQWNGSLRVFDKCGHKTPYDRRLQVFRSQIIRLSLKDFPVKNRLGLFTIRVHCGFESFR